MRNYHNLYCKRRRKQKIKMGCICGILLIGSVIACRILYQHLIKQMAETGASTCENVNTSFGAKGNERQGVIKNDLSVWNLILVNPWNQLPDDFFVERVTLSNGHEIDERAYPDLQDMMDAARAEGLSPVICSSYRTNEKQETLFRKKVSEYLAAGYSQKEAEAEAGKWVAVPGTSEHQTGLAVDIVSLDYQLLDKKQEETAEQKWLMENSYKYGFILRYPNDKSQITGIYYEPWHYRYVGKAAAKEIYEKGICLEEYLSSIYAS